MTQPQDTVESTWIDLSDDVKVSGDDDRKMLLGPPRTNWYSLDEDSTETGITFGEEFERLSE